MVQEDDLERWCLDTAFRWTVNCARSPWPDWPTVEVPSVTLRPECYPGLNHAAEGAFGQMVRALTKPPPPNATGRTQAATLTGTMPTGNYPDLRNRDLVEWIAKVYEGETTEMIDRYLATAGGNTTRFLC